MFNGEFRYISFGQGVAIIKIDLLVSSFRSLLIMCHKRCSLSAWSFLVVTKVSSRISFALKTCLDLN